MGKAIEKIDFWSLMKDIYLDTNHLFEERKLVYIKITEVLHGKIERDISKNRFSNHKICQLENQ